MAAMNGDNYFNKELGVGLILETFIRVNSDKIKLNLNEELKQTLNSIYLINFDNFYIVSYTDFCSYSLDIYCSDGDTMLYFETNYDSTEIKNFTKVDFDFGFYDKNFCKVIFRKKYNQFICAQKDDLFEIRIGTCNMFLTYDFQLYKTFDKNVFGCEEFAVMRKLEEY